MPDVFQRLHDALTAGETATVLKIAGEIDELNTNRFLCISAYPIVTKKEMDSAPKLDRETLSRRLKQAEKAEAALRERKSNDG